MMKKLCIIALFFVVSTAAHAAFGIFMASKPSNGNLLLENGAALLLENGATLLLE